jgi:hypothetical protein
MSLRSRHISSRSCSFGRKWATLTHWFEVKSFAVSPSIFLMATWMRSSHKRVLSIASLPAFTSAARRLHRVSGQKGHPGRPGRQVVEFHRCAVSRADGLIITPGTQGPPLPAVASTVSASDKVAIVQPDYFANRKLVQFFDGKIVPVRMNYLKSIDGAGVVDQKPIGRTPVRTCQLIPGCSTTSGSCLPRPARRGLAATMPGGSPLTLRKVAARPAKARASSPSSHYFSQAFKPRARHARVLATTTGRLNSKFTANPSRTSWQ